MSKSNKPKIALNMTTLNQGGVIQRAMSFIGNLDSALSEFDWHLLASKTINAQLKATQTTTTVPVSVFETSPSKNTASRKLIAKSITEINPQMVYTFGGPSYLKLAAPELTGITDGWMTHSDAEAYRSVPRLRNRWGLKLASRYKLQWCKKASHFIVQTETSKQGLAASGKINLNRIHVIPNALSPWYRNADYEITKQNHSQPIKIFCFAAAYSHKRHDMLPDVCKHLERLGLNDFEILITLPDDNPITQSVMSHAKSIGVAKRIRNLGPIPATDGVKIFQQCHICFMPTVLETFSATYLEAMATRTPIVTSNREFATEICGTGALYFESSNAQVAAAKIFEVVTQPEVGKNLVAEALKQLEVFPNVEQQMNIYRQTLSTLLSSNDFPVRN